jgi:hypothetical protein
MDPDEPAEPDLGDDLDTDAAELPWPFAILGRLPPLDIAELADGWPVHGEP